MSRYKKQYQEYLASPEWGELRKDAYERAGNRCELCHGSAAAVHHVKYPKRYTDDCLENLVVVCDKCHRRLHGLWDPPFDFPGITEDEEVFAATQVDKYIEILQRHRGPREDDFREFYTFGCRLLRALKNNMFRID